MPEGQGQTGFFDVEISDDTNLTNAIKTWEQERDGTAPLRKKFADANTRFQAQLGVEKEAEAVVIDLLRRVHAFNIIKAERADQVPHRYRCDGWVFEVTDETEVTIAPFTDETAGEGDSEGGPPPAQTPRAAAAAKSGKTKDALEDDAPAKDKPKPKRARKAAKKRAPVTDLATARERMAAKK